MAESKDPTKKLRGHGRRRVWSLLSALTLAALLAIGGAVFFSGTFRQEPTQDTENSGSVGQVEGPSAESASLVNGDSALGVPSRGAEDAPVVMVEYADFQCPNCGKFARDLEPELVTKYVENGTLRMEWRDFPYFGQESVNAALAARAAQEQGKFWEYHDLLYQNQGAQNSRTFSDEKLIALARELGLDVEQFQEGFTTGKYEPIVGKDFEEGAKKGIPGTPTFFINDKQLVGTQPVETFEQTIEAAAKEAENA